MKIKNLMIGATSMTLSDVVHYQIKDNVSLRIDMRKMNDLDLRCVSLGITDRREGGTAVSYLNDDEVFRLALILTQMVRVRRDFKVELSQRKEETLIHDMEAEEATAEESAPEETDGGKGWIPF